MKARHLREHSLPQYPPRAQAIDLSRSSLVSQIGASAGLSRRTKHQQLSSTPRGLFFFPARVCLGGRNIRCCCCCCFHSLLALNHALALFRSVQQGTEQTCRWSVPEKGLKVHAPNTHDMPPAEEKIDLEADAMEQRKARESSAIFPPNRCQAVLIARLTQERANGGVARLFCRHRERSGWRWRGAARSSVCF